MDVNRDMDRNMDMLSTPPPPLPLPTQYVCLTPNNKEAYYVEQTQAQVAVPVAPLPAVSASILTSDWTEIEANRDAYNYNPDPGPNQTLHNTHQVILPLPVMQVTVLPL